MQKQKKRQEVKRLLKEFINQLRTLFIPKISDLTLEEFNRIESKVYPNKEKGSDAKYF